MTPRSARLCAALSLALALAGAPGPSRAEPLVARGAVIGGDGAKTRFSLDLSAAGAVRVSLLESPYRVVVDLPEVVFDLPPGAGQRGHGLVTAWRFGRLAPGRSRIILDTAGPVVVDHSLVMVVVSGGPPKLVVDLTAAAPEAARAARLRLDEVGTVEHAALVKSDREAPRQPDPHKLVIVLDPGHGGPDAGTVSPATGTPEKQVVLEFTKGLAKKLVATGRYEVVLTRSDDRFLSLDERVRIARAHRADLLVSLHADAEYDRTVRGATVYTLAEKASDTQAAELAAKENRADLIAGVDLAETPEDVADILVDLTRRETRQFGQVFARKLVEMLRANGHTPGGSPLRSGAFRVLRANDVPSVLVELGFLSNREDEKLMMSGEWRDRTAASIVEAVGRFFAPRQARSARD